MRRLSLLAALLLSSSPTLGQERFDFTPRVKTGDVFTASIQRVEKIEFDPAGLLSGTMTRTIERVDTIVEAEGGRPTRFEERTVKHEDKMKANVAGQSMDQSGGDLQGVTLRYERVGETFEPTLIDGKLNPDVAAKLREAPIFPLNENFLPTVPLAVGESQTFTDQRRLAWVFKDTKSPVTFEEKPTISLNKVATIDGVRTGFLGLAFRARAESASSPGKEPESIQAKATILFDLDRGYVARIETREDLRASGGINGTKGITTVDVVTVNRFQKK